MTDATRRKRGKATTTEEFAPWEIVACYHFVILTITLLTLTCPLGGNDATRPPRLVAWNDTWDGTLWIQAGIIFMTTSAAFFGIHGTDPGRVASTAKNLKAFVLAMDNHRGSTYCKFCQWTPPLRAHHCRVCNMCVATFDHHCEFIGTCIGERNRCRFWWFLLIQAVGVGHYLCLLWQRGSLNMFHSVFQWLRFSTTHDGDSSSTSISWYMLWLALRIFLAHFIVYTAAAAAFFLLLLHTGMAISGTTTYEILKHPANLRRAPSSSLRCSLANIMENLHDYGCFGPFLWRQQPAEEWRPIRWRTTKDHHLN